MKNKQVIQTFFKTLNMICSKKETGCIYGSINSNKAIVISFIDGVIVGIRLGVEKGEVALKLIPISQLQSFSFKEQYPLPIFIQNDLPETSKIIWEFMTKLQESSLLDLIKEDLILQDNSISPVKETPQEIEELSQNIDESLQEIEEIKIEELSQNIDEPLEEIKIEEASHELEEPLVNIIISIFQESFRAILGLSADQYFETIVKRFDHLNSTATLDAFYLSLTEYINSSSQMESFKALILDKVFINNEYSLLSQIKKQFYAYLGPLAEDIYDASLDEIGDLKNIQDFGQLLEILSEEIDLEEDRKKFLLLELS